MDVITLEMTNEKIKEYCHVIRNPADEIPDYVQAIEKELEKEGKNLK
jgi:hypothetical protein